MRACVRACVCVRVCVSINLQKTKLMVVGHLITDEEKMPLLIGDSSIEYVDAFTYLGSVVAYQDRC